MIANHWPNKFCQYLLLLEFHLRLILKTRYFKLIFYFINQDKLVFFLSDLGIITTTRTKSNWFLIKYVLPFSINVPFLKGFLKQYNNGCKKITKQVICQLLSTFKLSKHYHLQFFCIQKICDISEYYHIVFTLVVI